jgi:hypothetical protein
MQLRALKQVLLDMTSSSLLLSLFLLLASSAGEPLAWAVHGAASPSN